MKPKPPCSIAGCWNDARTSGLCSACYSGMARLRTLTVHGIVHYMKRIDRLRARTVIYGRAKERTANVIPFKRRKKA